MSPHCVGTLCVDLGIINMRCNFYFKRMLGLHETFRDNTDRFLKGSRISSPTTSFCGSVISQNNLFRYREESNSCNEGYEYH